jgi:hypothetical protein
MTVVQLDGLSVVAAQDAVRGARRGESSPHVMIAI